MSRKKVCITKADNGFILRVLNHGESDYREPYTKGLVVCDGSDSLGKELSHFFDVPKITVTNNLKQYEGFEEFLGFFKAAIADELRVFGKCKWVSQGPDNCDCGKCEVDRMDVMKLITRAHELGAKREQG